MGRCSQPKRTSTAGLWQLSAVCVLDRTPDQKGKQGYCWDRLKCKWSLWLGGSVVSSLISWLWILCTLVYKEVMLLWADTNSPVLGLRSIMSEKDGFGVDCQIGLCMRMNLHWGRKGRKERREGRQLCPTLIAGDSSQREFFVLFLEMVDLKLLLIKLLL